MKRPSIISLLMFGLAALLANPTSLLACAACYGASDSPMAKGFNWGIFSLLAVVVTVLATIAGFFVYLARRAAAMSAATAIPAAISPLNSQPPPLTAD